MRTKSTKFELVALVLLIVSILLFVGAVVLYFVERTHLQGQDYFGLNLVGDFMSGAIGALLTITSVFYFIASLERQKDEITFSRETVISQSRENTLFTLLDFHRRILGEIDTDEGKNRGHEAIRRFFNRVKMKVREAHGRENKESAIKKFFKDDNYVSDFALYFQSVQSIFDYLDTIDAAEERAKLGKFAKNHFSPHEIGMIYLYYTRCVPPEATFDSLIREGFFDHEYCSDGFYAELGL